MALAIRKLFGVLTIILVMVKVEAAEIDVTSAALRANTQKLDVTVRSLGPCRPKTLKATVKCEGRPARALLVIESSKGSKQNCLASKSKTARNFTLSRVYDLSAMAHRISSCGKGSELLVRGSRGKGFVLAYGLQEPNEELSEDPNLDHSLEGASAGVPDVEKSAPSDFQASDLERADEPGPGTKESSEAGASIMTIPRSQR